MIHYLNIHRDNGQATRLSNNDGQDNCPHDGVRDVELTLEQHYGLRILYPFTRAFEDRA